MWGGGGEIEREVGYMCTLETYIGYKKHAQVWAGNFRNKLKSSESESCYKYVQANKYVYVRAYDACVDDMMDGHRRGSGAGQEASAA